jgi:phytoene synthase
VRFPNGPRLTSDLDIVTAEVRDGDRDRWLSVLYAPADVRPALLALHGLDLALERLVAGTTEPMIGAIRLAWWREALEGLDAGKVPAQPLLALIAAELLPRGITGTELAQIEDRWAELIGSETVPESFVAGGGRLFGWAARLLGGDVGQANRLGRSWAAGEVPLPASGAASAAVSAALRPLFGLALLAARDAARARAGSRREARASLARQWRLLAAIALGR